MSKLDISLKVEKKYPEFVAEVTALNVEGLCDRVSRLAQADADTSEAMENDEELSSASSLATELRAPYQDAKKAVRLKTRYLRNLIKEKGGA